MRNCEPGKTNHERGGSGPRTGAWERVREQTTKSTKDTKIRFALPRCNEMNSEERLVPTLPRGNPLGVYAVSLAPFVVDAFVALHIQRRSAFVVDLLPANRQSLSRSASS